MKPNLLYFLSRYLGHYLPHIIGASPNTIRAYSDTFKLLFVFIKERHGRKPNTLSLEMLDKSMVLEFSRWIIVTRACSVTTMNLRMSNIKAFFAYVQSEIPSLSYHAQTILRLPKKKTQRKVVEYITTEGIGLILQQPKIDTALGKKHLVMLSFMYATAARVQELIDVTLEDINYNHSNSVKLTGKGKKARLVPLERDVAVLLERYIAHEKHVRPLWNQEDALFLNPSGNKFTRQGIAYIVKKYATMAREQEFTCIPKNVHPHIFRHSRAMALLQAGVALIYIRDFLGHVSVTTTEVYARVHNELVRNALLKVSPLENSVEVPVWHQDKNLLEYLQALSE